MSDRRRRGKSVVLDQSPSLVTTSSESSTFLQRRNPNRFRRFAVRQVAVVLLLLGAVVYFVTKYHVHTDSPAEVSYGSRHVVQVTNMHIVPSQFSGTSNSRDGLKKAPADKAGNLGSSELGTSRKASTFFHYLGEQSPELVVVSVVDDKLPREYTDKIIENRLEYCQTHNYGLLVKYASDFQKYVDGSVVKYPGWAKVAISTEAQFTFPNAKWFWLLDGNALIMDPSVDILHTVLDSERLNNEIIPGQSVLRERNQHIRFYKTNQPDEVVFVSAQNQIGVGTDSFVFRNTQIARAMIQTWGEPLYRTSDNLKTEQYALGHMLQWHPQFLLRSAIIPPKLLGTYAVQSEPDLTCSFDENDFVALFQCELSKEACKRAFLTQWNARKRAVPALKENAPQVARDKVQNKVQVEAQERAQEKAEKQKERDSA
ncbi:alpha-1,6-mannosyltransferase [Starmerella bacillaris]|uniref:Alpha-1,6-mannosyltransferase n=1 Tax=Starmerella bacillaris TaxID=1247836 RepID=A0AAV5RD51_STABA|nr:alpha-1,6-mannosyltransferase [Starmerella bacillaris]